MLTVKNLTAAYGRIKALHGVSLHVQEKEIVSLIGANGAGKTTLLNAISGVLPPLEGSVMFQGRELKGLPPERIVKAGVSQVPEGRRIFAKLTVRENLELGAYLRHAQTPLWRRALAGLLYFAPAFQPESQREIEADIGRVFDRFPALAERRLQLAGTLSGGEQQMLAIGRALMSRPRILLLDEPSMGLAPRLVKQILETITALRDEGAAILLAEQNATAALAISDHAYVLEVGRVVIQGEAGRLAEDPEVKRAYLGKDYTEIWER